MLKGNDVVQRFPLNLSGWNILNQKRNMVKKIVFMGFSLLQ